VSVYYRQPWRYKAVNFHHEFKYKVWHFTKKGRRRRRHRRRCF